MFSFEFTSIKSELLELTMIMFNQGKLMMTSQSALTAVYFLVCICMLVNAMCLSNRISLNAKKQEKKSDTFIYVLLAIYISSPYINQFA